MKRLFSRRVVIITAAALLFLWLLRPGAGPLRGKVTRSISSAIGRRVEIGDVRIRFLPRPAFEIENLLVYDEPRFGAEPLLRSSDVTASLRLRSLLRGRIVISNLGLSDASLNLARDGQGRWNIEDLVERTSRTSLAPTGASPQDAGPSFPYIEATHARVNFKIGAEKVHFAFTDAEFALWQESGDTWGSRLRARPMRTDANLTDTGTVNLSGLWQRSATAHETPLQISFEWKRAQIGQLSRLLYGSDKGWRGDVLFSGTIQGTPEHLKIATDVSVSDFRRQDIIGGGSLELAAHCSAEYEPASRAFSPLDCAAPAGGGFLQLKGSVSGVSATNAPATSDLWLVLNKIPADNIASLLGHSAGLFPQSVSAEGLLDGNVQIIREAPDRPMRYEGTGTLSGLTMHADDGPEVAIAAIPLSLVSGRVSSHSQAGQHTKRLPPPAADRPAIEAGPVNLALAKNAHLIAQAVLTREDYAIAIRGESSLRRLLQVAKAFHVPAPAVAGDGSATVDLAVNGEWVGGQRPEIQGSAQLRAVKAQVRGLNAPIEITSADLAISRDTVRVQNISAHAAGALWRGSLQIPRPCPAPADCEVNFKLHAAELDASDLNRLVNPDQSKRAWYKILPLGRTQPAYLMQAKATGSMAIDSLRLGRTKCSHLTVNVHMEDGKLSLSEFKTSLMEGEASGTLNADFSVSPPSYSGSGEFADIDLSSVADLTRDPWISGKGAARYAFKASGRDLASLLSSADLQADFDVKDGSFPHVVLARRTEPLQAESFSGTLTLKNSAISFDEAKLLAGPDVYTVSGTASLNGALSLKAITENATGFTVTGTYSRTRVASIPAAEASLKP